MVPGPPAGFRSPLRRSLRRWAVLPAAAVLLAGCTSTPTPTTPVTTTPMTTPMTTAGPATTAGPTTTTDGSTDAASPSDTGDLTYTADGGPVTLVSDSFTGALPGYRITDGTDTLDAPTAVAVAADDSVLYVITGDGASAQLIRLTDDLDRWQVVDDEAAGLTSPGRWPSVQTARWPW